MNSIQKLKQPVLLIDDERHFLNSIETALLLSGVSHVECCEDPREVLSKLNEKVYSLILLDILMPHITGKELLSSIKESFPDIPVIMLTALSDVETVVECMKRGASDYLVKPIETDSLIKKMSQVIDFQSKKENDARIQQYVFSDSPQNKEAFSSVITQSPKMINIFKYIEAIAESPMPVLISGETGTGKDKIVNIIHNLSKRPGKLITINSAQCKDEHFLDALFGNKEKKSDGLIIEAEHGTLFLDEIASLSEKSQDSLLRLLQQGDYYSPVLNKNVKSDVRFISATSQDLLEMVNEGKFRNDLYQRLTLHQVTIPPLRERKEDIPLLVDYYLDYATDKLRVKRPILPKDVVEILDSYDFPGNIRELAKIVEMIMALSISNKNIKISTDAFLEKMKENGKILDIHITAQYNIPSKKGSKFNKDLPTFMEMEQMYIMEAFERANKDTRLAAQFTGLKRKEFEHKLNQIKEKL